jgi:hypothetical protein
MLWLSKKNMVGGKYHDPLSFLSNGVNKSDDVCEPEYQRNGD